jgi:phosphohistidine phosphatase sixA homolog
LVSSYVALLEKEGHSNLLLISHLPLVGDIVKELCGRNPASFYPATIVEVHLNNHRAEVKEIKYFSKTN